MRSVILTMTQRRPKRLTAGWRVIVGVVITALIYTFFCVSIIVQSISDSSSAWNRGYERGKALAEQMRVEDVSGGVRVMPLFLQTDPNWRDTAYASGSIETHGCGLCCLSMAVSYLTKCNVYPNELCEYQSEFLSGDYNDPDKMAQWARDTYGLEWSGELWGIEGIDACFANGWNTMIVDIGGPLGDETYESHLVLVYGIVDGMYLVRDPNSGSNSVRLFSRSELIDANIGSVNALR